MIQWFCESADDAAYFGAAAQIPELAFWMHTARDIGDLSEVEIPMPLRRLILILGYACTYGDLCIELSEEKIRKAEGTLRSLMEAPMPGLGVLTKYAKSILNQKELSGIVSHSSETPLVVTQQDGRSFLYFQKHFVSRRSVNEDFQTLARVRPSTWDMARALEAFGIGVEDRFTLVPEQRMAVALALYSSLAIITGGPGTGKTTVIVAILRALVALGIPQGEIRIVTPTGRAARRVRQAIETSAGGTLGDVQTSTLHSLLGFSRHRGDFKFSRTNRIPYQVIILDEVSMVDLGIMSRLLDSIRPGQTRLVLLGDRNQLPSVDSGAVLGDLVELLLPENQAPGYSQDFLKLLAELGEVVSARAAARSESPNAALMNCIVELQASHRSGETIRAAAQQINKGQLPSWNSQMKAGAVTIPEGCSHIDVETDEEFQEVLGTWAEKFFSPDYLQNIRHASTLGTESEEVEQLCNAMLLHMNSSRVLAFTRHGERGTLRINRFLKGHAFERGLPFEDEMHSGMPLMVIRNDYRRRIYNGETGLLLKFKNGFRWVFSEEDRIVKLAPAALPQTEAAHSITVHKSQGSEYENVLIVMPAELDHPILSRQILYTGFTRAKKAVAIVGSTASIQAALDRKISRETGGLRIDPAT